MARFEKVSKFANVDINLPQRKTADSAGYDMEVAEDIIVPPYDEINYSMKMALVKSFLQLGFSEEEYIEQKEANRLAEEIVNTPKTLDEVATITKRLDTKPTLVSTGMKCQLDPGTYLELSVRSSAPLKYWLVLANSVGVIDADYYNNPDNEGEIFFQIINLSPFPIQLKKGDIIGQGIFKEYLTTEDDAAGGERTGGFGSTSK